MSCPYHIMITERTMKHKECIIHVYFMKMNHCKYIFSVIQIPYSLQYWFHNFVLLKNNVLKEWLLNLYSQQQMEIKLLRSLYLRVTKLIQILYLYLLLGQCLGPLWPKLTNKTYCPGMFPNANTFSILPYAQQFSFKVQ